MKVRELNRDIKRLGELVSKSESLGAPNIKFDIENEFKRLYFSDKGAEYINASSIRIMIYLNLKYRFEHLHLFFSRVSI